MHLPAPITTFAALFFRASTLAAVALSLLPSIAAAQGPSFTQVPTTLDETRAYGVSPNGRFVTGGWSLAHVVNAFPFRWDRATGVFLDLGTAESLGSGGVSVLDDGRVFGNGGRYGLAPGNVFRWTPSTNQFDWVYTPTDPRWNDTLRGVSRDGQYGFGVNFSYTTTTASPVLYPFWQTSGPFLPIDLNMAPGSASFYTGVAGVSNPVNGVRRAYGTVLFPDAHGGSVWTLGFDELSRDTSWSSIVDITPGTEYTLGTVGTRFYIRGDGADRELVAPIFMTDPHPRRVSDDARVAVGYAVPSTLGGNADAVVWRKDQPPASLWAILSSAGVTVPARTSCVLHAVSADGSVVVGTFRGTDFVERAFAAVLPALNDNCTSARAITYGTVIASTNGATRAGVSGTCASEGAAPDVWFSFVPLANETVTDDTCGSSFDTTLTIYQASSCASIGAALACNDDASPACSENVGNSRLTAAVFAGTNYFIRVSGWSGALGTIRLTITAPNRPANDACAQAIDVPAGTGLSFNNTNAITDSRPPCAGTPFNDIWFKSVAPENGRMTFSTCGSSINTVMAVFNASACADLNAPAIACGSSNAGCPAVGGGNGTRITVPCTAGQILLVRVGGLFGSSGSGYFSSTFACDADLYSPYSVAVRNSGPINYWRFEDSGNQTAADAMRFDSYSCGNAPGQYIGSVLRSTDFQGKALGLNGAGGYARVWGTTSITTPSQCPGSGGRATLEAWIRTTDPYAGVVLTNRTNPAEFSLTLVVGYNTVGIPGTAGKIMFIADGPGNFHGAISTNRVDDGRWHHIVGIRGPTGPPQQYYIVVDNLLQGFDNLPGVGTANSGLDGAYWNIGNGPAWPVEGAAFNGRIDEVAIYCGNPNLGSHYALGKPCPADFNNSGSTTVQDIFDFLNAFFAADPLADFNRSGVITVQDIFDFLNAFFTACP